MPANQEPTIRAEEASALRCDFYHTAVEGISTFVPHHWHNALEWIYLRGGPFRLEIDMQPLTVEGDAFVLINPGELHTLASLGLGVEQAIVFDPSLLRLAEDDSAQRALLGPLAEGRLLLPHCIPAGHPLFAPLRECFLHAAEAFYPDGRPSALRTPLPAEDAAARLLAQSALLRALALLLNSGLLHPAGGRRANRKLDAIKAVLAHIRAHYQEPLYIGELAELAHMNEQYFCRFFRSMMGRPPMEFVNLYRCQQAARLLLETDLPIAEIGMTAGFGSVGNFLRTFKRYYQTSPLQYRKRMRGE